MKIIDASRLERLVVEILATAGTPSDIAECVASSLIDASLKGVESHGVMRVPFYVDLLTSGWIKPKARPQIEKETAAIAVINGNSGFGIYGLRYATELAIRKAQANNVAAVGLIETTHTGRLGWFVEKAAEQNVGMIIIGGGALGDTGHLAVAPYGGSRRFLSTNPYTLGLPGGRLGPVVVDISSSIVAEGKLKHFREKREALPPGWIIDKDGQPSTEVEDFYAGGMLLPAAGHKGYGLAVMADFLTGILLGQAYELNWLVLAFDITSFRPADEFNRAGEIYLQRLKEVPPAPGFDEVLIPGEPEARMRQQRMLTGIPIPDEIWEKIEKTAQLFGLDWGDRSQPG